VCEEEAAECESCIADNRRHEVVLVVVVVVCCCCRWMYVGCARVCKQQVRAMEGVSDKADQHAARRRGTTPNGSGKTARRAESERLLGS
jgi:hypothetical protein